MVSIFYLFLYFFYSNRTNHFWSQCEFIQHHKKSDQPQKNALITNKRFCHHDEKASASVEWKWKFIKPIQQNYSK